MAQLLSQTWFDDVAESHRTQVYWSDYYVELLDIQYRSILGIDEPQRIKPAAVNQLGLELVA